MMVRYIDAEQAIHLIENDALSQIYYSKSDAIDCINAMPTSECDSCMNGWVRISENGYSAKCTLSQKKAISCLTGVKPHYVARQDMRKEDEGKWQK